MDIPAKTETPFTQGPWHADPKAAEESFFDDVNILVHSGLAVAVAVHNGDIVPPAVEANARLIAAAPDLFAALVRIVEDGFSAQAEEQARTALSKANGSAL